MGWSNCNLFSGCGGAKVVAIDGEVGTITVRRTLARIEGELLWQEPKTARGRRKVNIGPDTVAVLRDQFLVTNKARLRAGEFWEDFNLVFSTGLGTPYSPRNVGRSFDRIIAKANLPKIRFHDLRHCHASLLLAQGENPKLISERLGHAQVSFTLQTYSHLLPGAQEAAAIKLEDQLRGTKKKQKPS